MAWLAGDGMLLVILAAIFIPVGLVAALVSYWDRHHRAWPAWRRRPFLALKYVLIALGLYVCIGRAIVEFHEGHLGGGIGMLIALAMALIGGLADAATGHTPDCPSGHPDPPPAH